MKKYLFIISLLLGLTVTVSFASEKQPMDVLKPPINKVIKILQDPKYHDEAKKDEQREKMWEIIRNIFDFKDISRRTLARNWKKLQPEQQKEFVDVFSQFLEQKFWCLRFKEDFFSCNGMDEGDGFCGLH